MSGQLPHYRIIAGSERVEGPHTQTRCFELSTNKITRVLSRGGLVFRVSAPADRSQYEIVIRDKGSDRELWVWLVIHHRPEPLTRSVFTRFALSVGFEELDVRVKWAIDQAWQEDMPKLQI